MNRCGFVGGNVTVFSSLSSEVRRCRKLWAALTHPHELEAAASRTREQGAVLCSGYCVHWAIQAGPSCFSVLLHLNVNLSLPYRLGETRVMSAAPQ